MSDALLISALKKSYGAVQALNGVDLTVPKGEFFGLLGPNGAGKSTLINCVASLQRASAGSIQVFGHPVGGEALRAKALIGLSPQEINLERFAPIEKVLTFQAGYDGIETREAARYADELLSQFRLTEKRNVPFYKLSGGMQKRVMIARALMGKPKLLILDEPTAGLDVELRHELWDFLRLINRERGVTILLTTHYIDEAELLCSRVGFINHGQLIELGVPKELLQKYISPSLRVTFNLPVDGNVIFPMEGVSAWQQLDPRTLELRCERVGVALEQVLARCLSDQIRLADVQVHPGNLEDVFIKLTGMKLDEIEKLGKAVTANA